MRVIMKHMRHLLTALFVVVSGLIFTGPAAAAPAVIGTTSVNNAAGTANQRHLVVTSDETVHAFLQLGTETATCGGSPLSGLLWFNSTDGGATWTCRGQLSSDTSNQFYSSAVTDSSDNIYVVYSTTGSGASAAYDIYYRKLTKGAGSNWTLESEQTVLDATAADAYTYSTIDLEGTTRIWLATRYYTGTQYQVNVYYSDGLGTAPSWSLSQANLDPDGTSSSASYNVPAVVRFGSYIGVLYSNSSSFVYFRHRSDSQDLDEWQAKTYAFLSATNSQWSVAGNSYGELYAIAASGISASYAKFHHNIWYGGNNFNISTFNEALTGIGIGVDNNTAWIAHNNTEGFSTGLAGTANYQTRILKVIDPGYRFNYTEETPELTPSYGTFDQYWSYVSGGYLDDTSDGSNTTTADTRMVTGVGDIAYFGSTDKFDAVAWDLSTNGTVGTVTWEYYDSDIADWSTLTFLSQTSANASNFRVDGYATFTEPTDWGTTQINGEGTPFYYIRARATGAYTTTPVGTQVAPLAPTPFMTMNAKPSPAGKFYVVWTEGAASTYRIRASSVTVSPDYNDPPSVSEISPAVMTYTANGGDSLLGMQGERLIKTSDGTLHTFMQSAYANLSCGGSYVGGLVWLMSSDGGTTWTCRSQFSGNHDLYATAATDTSDNIYVVYSNVLAGYGTDGDILYRKLTYTGSDWTIGSERTLLDSVSADTSYDTARILIEGTSRFWLSLRDAQDYGVDHRNGIYYSDGLSDNPSVNVSLSPVDTPGGTDGPHTGNLVRYGGDKIGYIYYDEDLNLYFRSRTDGDPLTGWNGATQITPSTVYNDSWAGVYSATGTTGGQIFLTWTDASNENVLFSYYNGSIWSSPSEIFAACANCGHYVDIMSDGSDVWVIGEDPTDHTSSFYIAGTLAYRKGVAPYGSSDFSASEYPYGYDGKPDQVWTYISGVYTDETTDANNNTASDVPLMASSGDIVYVGSSRKFDYIVADMTTNGGYPGYGLPVYWEYWNGISWEMLPTVNEATDATMVIIGTDMEVQFIPPDNWATTSVNGEGSSYYYVRIRLAKNRTNTATASKIYLIPEVNHPAGLKLVENGTPLVIWPEYNAFEGRVRINLDASVTPTPTPTPTPSPTPGATSTPTPTPTTAPSSSSGSVAGAVAPTCSDSPTYATPLITEVKEKGHFSLEVSLSPPSESFDSMVLAYGTSAGVYPYSVMGISPDQKKVTVGDLSPGTTYYFSVRSQKGCAPGFWSPEVSGTTRAFPEGSQAIKKILPPVPAPPSEPVLPTPFPTAIPTPVPTGVPPSTTATDLITGIVDLITEAFTELAGAVVAWFDPNPTVISGLSVTQIGDTYALVTWTTNHPASSKVSIGTSPDYGRDYQVIGRVTGHAVLLTGLSPSTTYFYEVQSQGKTHAYDARHEFATTATGDTEVPPAPRRPEPVLDRTTRTLSLIGLAAPGSAVLVLAFPPIIPLVPHIRFTPVNLLGILMGLLRKKRYPWGVVFDSQAHIPLDPAIVTLRGSSGVRQQITDLYGRYQFLAEGGDYTLDVVKTGYAFPSRKGPSAAASLYSDLYYGDAFSLTGPAAVALNIPLDRLGELPFNEAEKLRMGIGRFAGVESLVLRLSGLLYTIGFVFSVLALLVTPTTVNTLIVTVYAGILILSRIRRRTQPFGVVLNSRHRPIRGAAVTLTRKFPPGQQLTYTDRLGRYAFLVTRGHYLVTAAYADPAGQIISSVPRETPVEGVVGYVGEDLVAG
ncbi:hypothetical protein A2Z33_06390 [Candidatus Gottesmanbacteria bacterium RBG_16_52_11]|uniref:Fibronectin type-III domain-containing protein n=1 Tax=Candidatus Gottesmanbacteria bacterium RBG_16_52_11 TaxID=1798374 RepID=A0A1F5YXH2_9BACT|nr:MAG: hypothetical protein A2Z33_06390 [Candidatus Gottesmanbacteria bacterium RBG_16_52_11]